MSQIFALNTKASRWIISCCAAFMLISFAMLADAASETIAATTVDGSDSLATYLKPVSSFKADFKQTVVDENGELIEEYKGALLVKRPGKLHWQAKAPFAQTLVSDNKSIWFYDADLKQVTVREVNDSLTQAPALILSGDIAALKKHFSVKMLEQKQSSDKKANKISYLLKPKNANSLFENLTLVLVNDQLSQLIIQDGLQQTTTISLSNLQTNVKIADSEFVFKAPKGAKVIRDAQGKK